MQEQEVILSLKGITKRFPGVVALDRVDFALRRGEVHALIGENGAGKSTLMKIILGIYQPDEGEIRFKGKRVQFPTPHDALSAGISMIHQEVSLIPTVSAAENIWIGRDRQFLVGGLISLKKRNEATLALLEEWGIPLDYRRTANEMSMAEMQLVEIARAISYNADVIIMDEPTSSLAEAEVAMLYDIIRRLAAKGVAIIFISHKLEEIFEICQRTTVYRDGKNIGTRTCAALDTEELIRMIAGREVQSLYPKEEAEPRGVALEVRGLSSAGAFQDVSFSVRGGEIVGFCGLVGAGRTEIMRAIFGIDRYESGEVCIGGKKVVITSPKKAIRHGLGMVTEDRLHLGILPILSVRQNMTLSALHKVSNRFAFISGRREKSAAAELKARMDVRAATLEQPIRSLSGGNQQKAIIARWLFAEPRILILDEPTRGIDVGSKSEIHRYMSKLAGQGLAIILVSSELPEVVGMSDRIFVVRGGRIVSEYRRGCVGQEQLIQDAFGSSAVSHGGEEVS